MPQALQVRQWYQDSQMPLLPWSSLCGGFFSGRFTRENLDSFTDGADQRCVRCYCGEDNFQRLDRVAELTEKKGASLAQIALAWMIHGPLDCYPLTAAWTPAQAVDNAAAAEVELSEEEIAWLDLH